MYRLIILCHYISPPPKKKNIDIYKITKSLITSQIRWVEISGSDKPYDSGVDQDDIMGYKFDFCTLDWPMCATRDRKCVSLVIASNTAINYRLLLHCSASSEVHTCSEGTCIHIYLFSCRYTIPLNLNFYLILSSLLKEN